MPTLLERITARIAFAHARRVFRTFMRAASDVRNVQTRLLRSLVDRSAHSAFGTQHNFSSIKTIADFRSGVPISNYEDMRPFIDRVMDGDVTALFGPGERIWMFATSSGTTDRPKYIPVTSRFVAEYRRGWNTFGCKMLTDHPRAVLRGILQCAGRFDESRSRSGIACGAITGLLARTQKRIVRRFYVAPPEVADIDEVRGRYYTLMRLAIVRDVAFAVTANPSTLIQLARVADEESEELIRDVRDGTISRRFAPDLRLNRQFLRRVKPDPNRAKELQVLRSRHQYLRPRDYWRLEFLACWIGGSMGFYLERLRHLYGDLPVRDVGLLASEGRVTIPFGDGVPSGVLDVPGSFFEFIPLEDAQKPQPETRLAWELEVGRDYVVVLTNAAGLFRYRLDDVVRVHGHVGESPVLEFICRAGRVSSIAGEKLTEAQVVRAMMEACRQAGSQEVDFALAPCWSDPPYYRLSCDCTEIVALPELMDLALGRQNDEYLSRRKSMRLGAVQVRYLPRGSIQLMDERIISDRGAKSEQYKRQCLFTSPGDDDALLNRINV